MATYLLLEDGGRITQEDASGFILLEVQDAVTSTPSTETMQGGGQEEIERYKAYKRNLEAKRERAEELRERLAKAEQEKQRKAKARAQSKAKQAIEARILRFAREIEETEDQIASMTLELSILQAKINQLAILDQRRRLLLIALAS